MLALHIWNSGSKFVFFKVSLIDFSRTFYSHVRALGIADINHPKASRIVQVAILFLFVNNCENTGQLTWSVAVIQDPQVTCQKDP